MELQPTRGGTGGAGGAGGAGDAPPRPLLEPSGEFLELADAATEFASVADLQQQQQELRRQGQEQFEASQGAGSGSGAAGQRDEAFRGVMAPHASRSLKTVAFVVFSVLVFGAIAALNVFCVYLGITNVSEPCGRPLAPWVATQGFLGLLSTALLIVVTIPPGVQGDASGSDGADLEEDQVRLRLTRRHGFLRHRIQPPSFSRDSSSGERNRRIVGALGVVQLLMLCWFVTGTAWVAQADADGCPALLHAFTLGLVVALWVVLALLCLVSCTCLLRRRSDGDSNSSKI